MPAEGEEFLTTREALAYARLDPAVWQEMISRGKFKARPVAPGLTRTFDSIDAVGAVVLRMLVVERFVKPAMACAIAQAVVRSMRHDRTASTLSAWLSKPGSQKVVVAEIAPSADAIEIFRFAVDEIRMGALHVMREKLRQSAANQSGSRPAVSPERKTP
jgi:hypothetical protein